METPIFPKEIRSQRCLRRLGSVSLVEFQWPDLETSHQGPLETIWSWRPWKQLFPTLELGTSELFASKIDHPNDQRLVTWGAPFFQKAPWIGPFNYCQRKAHLIVHFRQKHMLISFIGFVWQLCGHPQIQEFIIIFPKKTSNFWGWPHLKSPHLLHVSTVNEAR